MTVEAVEDNVPWMVEGNVEHSTNVARLLAYAAFGGAEGVIGPSDLEVRELDVPGPEVQVLPGAGAILNRSVGAKYEAYAFRVPAARTVPIAATDSSGGRTDLIVARIENPYLNGEPWPMPDPNVEGSAQDYDYLNLVPIPNVGNEAPKDTIQRLGYSAIPLAKVVIPVSTATITQAMLTDVRGLTQSRKASTFNIIAPTQERRLAVSGDWVNWPPEANMSVDVPDWATHAKVRALVGGARFGPGNVYGELRIQFGIYANAFFSQNSTFNVDADNVDRTLMMAGAPAMSIPRDMRGTTQSIRIEGKKTGGTTDLWIDASSMVSLEIEFTQAPESNG
jgi:hypothetical protein